MPEAKMTMNIIDPAGSRLGYMKKLLEKVHNGVIRKTWKFECCTRDDETQTSYSKQARATSGNFIVDFGFWYDIELGGYFISKTDGSEQDNIHEDFYSSTFSNQELDLIIEYLKKIEAANWQAKSVDLDTLPE